MSFRSGLNRPRQQCFFKPSPKEFGGSLLKGNPREKRILSFKNPVHMVLKSKHAKRDWSFRHKSNFNRIDATIRRHAKLNNTKVYGLVIMSNHIHFNLLFPNRNCYIKFARSISGLIPRIVMGCQRGNLSMLENFWLARPWTKILSWGRQFKGLKAYFNLNVLEAVGFSRQEGRPLLNSTA